MGVRISKSGLASAVANAGCCGTIASVGLGAFENVHGREFVSINNQALRDEIARTRARTNRPFAVNIMGALSNYREFVKVCVEEGVAIIISGAGLPLDLPQYDPERKVRLVPIVSSARALSIIIRKWQKNYQRQPDAVIIEGPMAGGHLGYAPEELDSISPESLFNTFTDVKNHLAEASLDIPIVVAGGIFDGTEAARFLREGASGVQMATRFVCTEECDADIRFKQEYLRATREDIVVIHSPVGLPGRVIMNPFVRKMVAGERIGFTCLYQCLKTCDPKKSQYCIAKALADAARGNFENAFAFAGQNAYRCTEITTVPKLVATLREEMEAAI
ncbi:MAG: nitronate monooxygenase family protein [Chitinispirillaceae bacterium]|nr:nitronate monooxygenase family protein [Chitinispirillaceae bacterium]